MPELEDGAATGGVGGATPVSGGGGVAGGGTGTNTPSQDAAGLADGPEDAVNDDSASSCEELAEELAAENEALRGRVAELESMLAGVELRFELERSLIDAGVIDIETALAVSEARVEAGDDPSAIVSELVSTKPFLFRSARPSGRGSALGGAAAGIDTPLTGLADEARRTGDRRALTRYLRKRRQG
ncbi:MAG: hypothetical protein AAFN41_10465 [Planctomycetota bacterium]